MGKYMRKAKATADVAVMEVSSSSSLGVRTRAKTLALKRSLQKSPPPSSGGSYQLRSRRLDLKPAPKASASVVSAGGKQRQAAAAAKLACARNPRLPAEEEVVEMAAAAEVAEEEEEVKGKGGNEGLFVGEEASFGENVLEFEVRERGIRESTPSSLIRDPDAIPTPGSTTRQTTSAELSRRPQNSSQRHIPTTNEMDEFFAGAEVEQHKQFIDKYNFDPVNDKPLPGRYKWEKVDS